MEDWQLLNDFRETRSELAFHTLVERYLPLVVGYCRRRLRDAALAEDVAQSVFIVLARKPPTQREGAALASWLLKTAQFACSNAARVKMRREKHEAAARACSNGFIAAAAPPQEVDMLDSAMAELPDSDRDVLMLRFYNQLEPREIGERLGLSANTAAKRIQRALDRLRRFFQQNGAAFSPALAAKLIHDMKLEAVVEPDVAQVVEIALQPTGKTLAFELAERSISMLKRTQFKLILGIAASIAIGAGGIAAAVALIEGHVPGQVQAVAAPPASQPAVASSLSPQQTLFAFVRALMSGNRERIVELVETENDDHVQLVTAVSSFAESSKKLNDAVTKAYGAAAAGKLKAFNTSPVDSFVEYVLKNVPKTPVKIDGDLAIIQPAPEMDAMVLHRVEGTWKISAARMTETWPVDVMRSRTGELLSGADALGVLAQEVSEGKYATFDEFAGAARQLLQKR